MRTHRDGYIQCRTMEVTLPLEFYRRALTTYPYRNEGIEAEVGKYLGIELENVERFRIIGQVNKYDVLISVYSNWVQPTRS